VWVAALVGGGGGGRVRSCRISPLPIKIG